MLTIQINLSNTKQYKNKKTIPTVVSLRFPKFFNKTKHYPKEVIA